MPFFSTSGAKRSDRCQCSAPSATPPPTSIADAAAGVAPTATAPSSSVAGNAAGVAQKASRRARSGAPSNSGRGASAATAATRPAMWSCDSSSRLMRASESSSSPLRMRSSTLSTAWVKCTTASSPNRPAEPLMVWAQRNSACSSSVGSAAVSARRRISSICASSSRLSSRKVARAWERSISVSPAWRARHPRAAGRRARCRGGRGRAGAAPRRSG